MIYFVRHGVTDWNENKNENGQRDPRMQGRIDIPLNEKGIAQARVAAEILKDIKFDRVLCSPLTRTRQTCEIIYKGDKEIEYDSRLIERDFGEFEGLIRSSFDLKSYCNEYSSPKLISAESIPSVKQRLKSVLDELKNAPDDNVLIVSHGGVGCILLGQFKGIPEDGDYSSFKIPNAQPLILDINDYINN